MRHAYLKMIGAYPGGWVAMARDLGMISRAALENRVYERHGQAVRVDTALQMQNLSKTTVFAEFVAQKSGGVFLQLPQFSGLDNDDLLGRFTDLYEELGNLSRTFKEATADNEVDQQEKVDLTNVAQNIHRLVQDLLQVTFLIYCRQE